MDLIEPSAISSVSVMACVVYIWDSSLKEECCATVSVLQDSGYSSIMSYYLTYVRRYQHIKKYSIIHFGPHHKWLLPKMYLNRDKGHNFYFRSRFVFRTQFILHSSRLSSSSLYWSPLAKCSMSLMVYNLTRTVIFIILFSSTISPLLCLCPFTERFVSDCIRGLFKKFIEFLIYNCLINFFLMLVHQFIQPLTNF